MRNLGATLGLAIATLMLLSGCAGLKGPPDPAKVQQKISATLNGEKELIRATVASAERADGLIALLDQRDRLVAQHADTMRRHRERMSVLNADYDAERSSFEDAIADYNNERLDTQRDLAELIEAMKREVTAEEWKAIAKYELKKLDPRELAYEPAGGGS